MKAKSASQIDATVTTRPPSHKPSPTMTAHPLPVEALIGANHHAARLLLEDGGDDDDTAVGMLRTVLQDARQRLQHEMNNRGELLPTEMCPFVVPIFPENFDDNHALDFFSYPFILQDDNMEDPTLCSNNTGGPPPVASLASPVGRLLGLSAACFFSTGMACQKSPQEFLVQSSRTTPKSPGLLQEQLGPLVQQQRRRFTTRTATAPPPAWWLPRARARDLSQPSRDCPRECILLLLRCNGP
jgi:hypothetical protein